MIEALVQEDAKLAASIGNVIWLRETWSGWRRDCGWIAWLRLAG
jgi:hypothetical protein